MTLNLNEKEYNLPEIGSKLYRAEYDATAKELVMHTYTVREIKISPDVDVVIREDVADAPSFSMLFDSDKAFFKMFFASKEDALSAARRGEFIHKRKAKLNTPTESIADIVAG